MLQVAQPRWTLDKTTAGLGACLLMSGYLNFAADSSIVMVVQAVLLVAVGIALGCVILRSRSTKLYILGVAYVGLLACTSIFPNLIRPLLPHATTLSLMKLIKFEIVMLYSVLLGIFCLTSPQGNRFWKYLAPVALGMLLLATALTGLGGAARLGNEHGNAIWYARLAGLNAIFIVLPAFDKHATFAAQMFRFAAVLVLLVLIALSGSRGPAIAFTIVMLAANIGWLVRYPIRVMLSAQVAVLAGWLAYSLGPDAISERFMALFYSDLGDIDGGRTQVIEMCGRIFAEQPLGMGFGGFERFTDIDYPHNILMECLVEPGAVFGVLYIVPMLVGLALAFIGLANSNKHENQLTIPCAICVFAFFNAMVSGDMTSPRLLYITATFLCVRKLVEMFSRTGGLPAVTRRVVSQTRPVDTMRVRS